LFRTFGENYHERALEETFIFPRVKSSRSEAAGIIDVLLAQHERGRQITNYIMAVTARGKLNPSNAEQLARAFDSFVLMYQEHTAREDTIVFPAWHRSLSGRDYDEMGERFEGIERKQFGRDGFEAAVKQISDIEQTLGLGDLSQFTAPTPPARV
jgi:hemerythrin-like domain-containing protein